MFVSRFALAALVFGLADVAPGGGGCRDESTSHTNSVQTLDGSVTATPACHATPLAATACGVADGLPFYGYYDGCNWCGCSSGHPSCTARACTGGDVAFTPNDCNTVYWGASGIELPTNETWTCDASGRLYRSACAPEGATPAVH